MAGPAEIAGVVVDEGKPPTFPDAAQAGSKSFLRKALRFRGGMSDKGSLPLVGACCIAVTPFFRCRTGDERPEYVNICQCVRILT